MLLFALKSRSMDKILPVCVEEHVVFTHSFRVNFFSTFVYRPTYIYMYIIYMYQYSEDRLGLMHCVTQAL